MDRLSQTVHASGSLIQTQTSIIYDDINRIITTTSDLSAYNDNALVSKMLYDGLGRTTEGRQYEGGTNYIATQTQYDSLGRAYKVSNPFRPWKSESAVWTTSGFDALSRVISVTTPDNAVVATAYSGNTVTVTDQIGRKRKSVTDGLGRLIQLYEDPVALNYLTSYTYDVLDNLTNVSQGVQTRTFVYDSLKRLTSATNPESGAVTYGYDNNGNLTTKLDARNITTTFAYDALNRATSKTYNDTPQTPRADYYYDNAPMPSGAPTFTRGSSTGRLVAVTYGPSSSQGTYRGYDELGEVVRQYQRTDSVNYLVDATYNKAGAVATEVYPTVPGAADRRTVSYTPDAAGRLGSLSTLATTYAPAASVTGIMYASHNALLTETYGNNLIHAQVYNNRLQPTAIKLGTVALPTSVMNLTYNYGATNNNGNVQSLTYAGGGLSYTQTFGYDQLNRLTTSQEGTSWSQTNSYDRYGNRTIVGGGLTFNADNNRITTVGYAYDVVGNLSSDNSHGYNFDAENKISKVDAVSAYVYDGEGQRVRKLVNENLRFIYDMGGKEIAEFNGTTGTLTKEYIYGASGLVATIEPTALNANGTRYTTSDTLGSPRVVTNSSAVVISRHDYKPFSEEIGLVGGRTTGMGYSVADGVRQKFTSKERDNETGLDFFEARYFGSAQGRFTSPDPLGGHTDDPQTLDRYTYVRNNPQRFTDPTGLDFYLTCGGKDSGTCHDGQVGTTDKKGNFTATLIRNDKNGGLVDQNGNSYTANVSGAGVSFTRAGSDQGTLGVFQNGTNATTIQGSGGLAGFTFNFTSSNLNVNITAQGSWSFSGNVNQAEKALESSGYIHYTRDNVNPFHRSADAYDAVDYRSAGEEGSGAGSGHFTVHEPVTHMFTPPRGGLGRTRIPGSTWRIPARETVPTTGDVHFGEHNPANGFIEHMKEVKRSVWP